MSDGGSGAAVTALPPPLARPYTLVTFLPFFFDGKGGIWLERLWHRDFVRHLTYIQRLTLVAPALPLAEAAGLDLVHVDVPEGSALRCVALPSQHSWRSALWGLPKTAGAIFREVSRSEIVHTGIVGWPYPLGWLAGLAAIARRKQLMILVESAPWRFKEGASLKKRARAVLNEAAARFFVNRASVSFFTQSDYRETMLTAGRGPGWIIPASWIDENEVRARAAAEDDWRGKRNGPVRLLFAARLEVDKGVRVLLEAVRRLRAEGVAVELDLIGDGSLRAECAAAAAEPGPGHVNLLTPVAYGAPFFSLLRQYHAVLVPNLGDEQPRIVFDAYAQAVPVIASDSTGLRPHVAEGQTGWLVQRGDAAALAAVIARALGSPGELARMGLRAHDEAGRMTHLQMHVDRWRHLYETLGA